MDAPTPSFLAGRAAPDPFAGVLAGLIAGAVYLLAQMLFAALHGGAAWEPLQRFSAMLLGDDVLPPPGEIDLTIAGFALLIHFGLAIVFGRVVDLVVTDHAPAAAVGWGALVGLALYGLDYWLVTPVAFPWFENARGLTTLIDHLLFGVVAAVAYVHLRRILHPAGAAAAAAGRH